MVRLTLHKDHSTELIDLKSLNDKHPMVWHRGTSEIPGICADVCGLQRENRNLAERLARLESLMDKNE